MNPAAFNRVNVAAHSGSNIPSHSLSMSDGGGTIQNRQRIERYKQSIQTQAQTLHENGRRVVPTHSLSVLFCGRFGVRSAFKFQNRFRNRNTFKWSNSESLTDYTATGQIAVIPSNFNLNKPHSASPLNTVNTVHTVSTQRAKQRPRRRCSKMEITENTQNPKTGKISKSQNIKISIK